MRAESLALLAWKESVAGLHTATRESKQGTPNGSVGSQKQDHTTRPNHNLQLARLINQRYTLQEDVQPV